MQLYVTEEAFPAQSYYAEHWTPVYLKSDVEVTLAAKDRDLADANHMLLAANASADSFKRVAEQRQAEVERYKRAVEWCLQKAAYHGQIHDGRSAIFVRNSCCAAEVPAEFADIIKPTTGASNG